MASLPETFDFPTSSDDLSNEELLRLLSRIYTDLARAINRKPDVVVRDTVGSSSDTFLANGTINVDTSNNTVEVLTNHTSPTNVTWTTVS